MPLTDVKAPPKSHGIIFSAPMVRALLTQKKTQTRRTINPQPGKHTIRFARALSKTHWLPVLPISDSLGVLHGRPIKGEMHGAPIRCPYGKVGDLLWVRETWGQEHFSVPGDNEVTEGRIRYKADRGEFGGLWRSPIHMPRWASRITLRITEIRVERLHDISAKDIIAEGLIDRPHQVDGLGKCPVSAIDGVCYVDLKSLWAGSWDRINGKGAYKSNPWVWAISFQRVEKEGGGRA